MELHAGTVVWMKIKGYPKWPAQIIADPDTGGAMTKSFPSRTEIQVHSYGDHKIVWVPTKQVELFAQPSDSELTKAKGKLRAALEEATVAMASAYGTRPVLVGTHDPGSVPPPPKLKRERSKKKQEEA